MQNRKINFILVSLKYKNAIKIVTYPRAYYTSDDISLVAVRSTKENLANKEENMEFSKYQKLTTKNKIAYRNRGRNE